MSQSGARIELNQNQIWTQVQTEYRKKKVCPVFNFFVHVYDMIFFIFNQG